ncbi:MAG: TetR/AcrR family transcriptional regulator [Anaerolinea sp.]|nr:TetR/AcrR family transcriptional regulator [Anaerolinea sp.]
MDNRETILEHAMALFSERGYDAVGVQEICEAAGITKPTLYHYFGSKRGLLEAILDSSFTELKTRLTSSADYGGDMPFTLQAIAETYFSFASEYPAFYRLQLALWFAPQESEGFKAVIVQNRFQYEVIEKIFLNAVTQHGNMRGRHQAYALTFLGTLNTYIGLGLNGLATLDADLARQAVRQFQYGIYS